MATAEITYSSPGGMKQTCTVKIVGPDPVPDWMKSLSTNCIVCGNKEISLHCKLRCNHCGAMRDCSDP